MGLCSPYTALLLQPALFVHFCWAYPQSIAGFVGPRRRSRAALLGIYSPAAILGLVYVALHLGALRVAVPLAEALGWLYRDRKSTRLNSSHRL